MYTFQINSILAWLICGLIVRQHFNLIKFANIQIEENKCNFMLGVCRKQAPFHLIAQNTLPPSLSLPNNEIYNYVALPAFLFLLLQLTFSPLQVVQLTSE